MSMPKPKVKKSRATASKKKTKESPDLPPPDDNLPNLKFYPEEDETPEELRNVRIDFDMIARRNLPDTSQEMCHDDIVSALHAVSHIRLDREHITHIDNLEMLGTKVTHLYLQQNHVRHPENLECLVNLQFLTLSGNQITRVENLSCLDQLKFLDLSDNQIQELDVEELPKSLMILSLEGNPCTSMDGYRATVLAALSNLCQLDGVLLGDEDDEESESDDDEGGTSDGTRVRPGGGGGGPDLGDSYYPRRSLEEYFEGASIERTDVFDDVMTSLRDRSKLRQAEMDDQHSAHNEILRKIREDAKT